MTHSPITNNYLRQYIDRIERLNEEKADIASTTKEVFAEAKANGFDPKIMREIIKERKLTKAQREERDYLLDTYKNALGMMQASFDFKEQKQTDIEDFTGDHHD